MTRREAQATPAQLALLIGIMLVFVVLALAIGLVAGVQMAHAAPHIFGAVPPAKTTTAPLNNTRILPPPTPPKPPGDHQRILKLEKQVAELYAQDKQARKDFLRLWKLHWKLCRTFKRHLKH